VRRIIFRSRLDWRSRFMTAALYQIPITRIDGRQATRAECRGSVLLIVNVPACHDRLV
jgi:hypothetical protein